MEIAAPALSTAARSTPSTGADALIGRRVHQYAIEELVGEGGMGRVYRARHLSLERPCAIKVLSAELAAKRREFIEMFLAEARTAASLIHPNVVTIHNIGQIDDHHFIEMEYVEGESAWHLCQPERGLDALEATHLLMQAAAALALAHEMGMVHRDIKPANILVTSQGIAKLADFGLAHHVRHSQKLTAESRLLGTPNFMAPELFLGAPADARSDIYAMGVTLFCLLTGQHPYVDASIVGLAEKHRDFEIPDPACLRPMVPPEACAVVNRCMSKNPADRYPNARALYDDLKLVFGGLRDPGALVRESLADLDADLSGDDDHFRVQVRLAAGRLQTVHIEVITDGPITEQLVRIYSVCGPMNENHLARALRLNSKLTFGAIGIETVDGSPHFVMMNAYPRATCDPHELRESVLLIARFADRAERALTGEDRF